MEWKVKNLDDLPFVVCEILKNLHYKVILLYGEMGAGKTTLIKEILHQLQSKDRISSPTYTLVNEYDTPIGPVFHFDFYRIDDVSEAYDMGWEEYVYSGNLCLVEWPERINSILPEEYHTLQIHNLDETRIIQFT
ncbi:MAG: tRNA (adenosine(37)-N6)-threonylcarbamoyltransferase complex ATPase subunit type 1 TsaE [Flavobacteriaceae bacterium]|nr:tRNA (adenosine(37)-N6)-threonylcarbamoyltransferase complex ATPase subunit type 1 TsaE [Flavobacteriaceae bacterium]